MPEVCVTVELPVVEADFCGPDIDFGEVDRIYIGNPGNPFTDWTSLTEWNARLDNAATGDATKIRFLNIIGDKPEPEKGEIKFSQDRTAYTTPKHVLNFKVDETGPNNYGLVQFFEDNNQTALIWFGSGKYLYGGNSGISANLKLSEIIPESSEELKYIQGVANWEAKSPDRITNPMA